MPDEPESLGTGLGPLLADYIPLLPSGARRAGAARVMAARVGREPSFLVNNPIKTQLAALGIGAVGNVLTKGKGAPTRIAATVLPILLVQALRRREIKSIQEDYDTEDRKRLRDIDTTAMFGGIGGSSRLGAVGAYEAMRKRKYQDIGHLSEVGDALTMATSGAALPVTSWIDHKSADRMQKDAGLIGRGIGRVVTNLVEPYGYGVMDKLKRVKSQGLMNNLKAVVDDRPAYKLNPDLSVRNLPYRRMFGLPAHREGLGNYTKNGPGSFRLSGRKYESRNALEDVAMVSRPAPEELPLPKEGIPFVSRENPAMAGYDGRMMPGDRTEYTDRWDFDLHPHEKVNSVSALLRSAMSKVTKPVMIEGAFNRRTLEHLPLRKEADFSDQKNSPTIPLYLAAALASLGGSAAASAWSNAEFANSPALDKKEWAPLARHVSGKAPPVFNGGDMGGNAFYTKPADDDQGRALVDHVQSMERVEPPANEELQPIRNRFNERRMLMNRLKGHGAIVADEKSSAGVLAHEAGHAKIEHTPGVLQFLQRHLYPHRSTIAPLAGVGSMAAGLASGSTLNGALLGTGIGLVSGLGTIAPEAAASYYGLKGLQDYKGGALSSGQTSPLVAALSTYLAAGVLPSTLAGAAGGWISGKRRAEDVEKEASLADLLKVDARLAKAFHNQQSGLLTQSNRLEEMRRIWTSSPLLRQRFKQPPANNQALDYIGGLMRDGEVG